MDEIQGLEKRTGFQHTGQGWEKIEWWQSPNVVIDSGPHVEQEYWQAMKASGWYPDGKGGWSTENPWKAMKW